MSHQKMIIKVTDASDHASDHASDNANSPQLMKNSWSAATNGDRGKEQSMREIILDTLSPNSAKLKRTSSLISVSSRGSSSLSSCFSASSSRSGSRRGSVESDLSFMVREADVPEQNER